MGKYKTGDVVMVKSKSGKTKLFISKIKDSAEINGKTFYCLGENNICIWSEKELELATNYDRIKDMNIDELAQEIKLIANCDKDEKFYANWLKSLVTR